MGMLYFNGVLLKLNACFYLFYITKTKIPFYTLQFHVDLQLPLYPKKQKCNKNYYRSNKLHPTNFHKFYLQQSINTFHCIKRMVFQHETLIKVIFLLQYHTNIMVYENSNSTNKQYRGTMVK